ncbi:DNA-binding transcriptional regulator, FadR family [Pannonibacter indicus]|uniref:DNA-binding transcriptional regulator, FadR family n=2 Tax=Pannonibacter indicus TaxID=466044 RepID=A0A0K6HPX1_9HYPH|nr:DNA-binding transcriptional regulator, FadR family [Pannonibacter indicus]
MNVMEPSIANFSPRNSHGRVVDVLGREIVDGKYPSGAVLPGDNELAERFQVSRTVLREAMKTLAAKGMVQARARIGTKVTDRKFWNLFDGDVLSWHFSGGVDAALFNHLSDVRLALEPAAASMAALNASDDDIRTLHRLTDAMRDAEDARAFAEADMKFHLAVLEASRNPFMSSVGSLIGAALVSIFRLSSPTGSREGFAETAGTHRAIADAIGQRDPQAAAKAMERVIIIGRDRVLPSARQEAADASA